jgi:hypothetical protein
MEYLFNERERERKTERIDEKDDKETNNKETKSS